MTFGRRVSPSIPALANRQWNDVREEFQLWAEAVSDAQDNGLPPGFSDTTPETISGDSQGSSGSESSGWAAADHAHDLNISGSVSNVTLTGSSTQGSGPGVALVDHTHVLPSNLYDHDLAWLRPTTAHVNDDEFRDASVNAAWTQTDPASPATWTENGDVISASVAGGDPAQRLHALTKTITGIAAGTEIVTAVRILCDAQQYPFAGLIFSDGSTAGAGVQVSGHVYLDSAAPGTLNFQLLRTTNFDTLGSAASSTTWAHIGPQVYLKLVYNAANSFRLEVSPDGVSWIVAIANTALTLTPTRGGLVASTNGGASAVVASFEHFRVA